MTIGAAGKRIGVDLYAHGCEYRGMNNTTTQAIEIGTRIFYTGDRANPEGVGTVTGIRRDSRFGDHLVIEWDADHDGATRGQSLVMPCQFRPGPGRRFMTLAERRAEQGVKIALFLRSVGKTETEIEEYLSRCG